ncbi:hypothetical protein KSP40_PGU019027 [Platanthera guangdongensis]|uniref:Pectinesterase inhibitor domain-containing protein n=1 Tax=Platanthera guangdongensis TaxID=2320717 RepID=A0ABR2LN48_9ASPA
MEINRRFALAATAAAVITLLCFTAGEAVPFQFIRSSCKVTQYPNLCEKSLCDFKPALQRRSPRQLAHAALTVTSQRAVRVSNFVRRVSADAGKSSPARGSHYGGGVRDCVETLGESVDRLRLSVKEMERMGRYRSRSFRWHLSNVQTWVSAAITDQTTCIDSLAEDKSAAGPQIRSQIVYVNHLASNALALINRLNPINN